ncbi:MAG: hypothetical protein JETT_2631 [Candidatus Jettenia ecosi]|uniref:Uncharacterized protein n=1 Tax=Candidatus Jettenia ecosi TaxID=2494326 RepID=A0A533QKM1_9BACT|nr:MAG: hypothetical protein JETT_2631 [Candidatus Jettenia ecosi]
MSIIVIKNHRIDEKKKKEVCNIAQKHLFNAYKYCGIINWKIEPVKYQKELRDEWKHME